MTRTTHFFCATALAILLAATALPAAAADDATPVDAATAEATAQGAVCPVGALKAEQLQVRQQDAIEDIGRMLAEQAPPDPEIRVLNGNGYNYAPIRMGAPPPPAISPR